MFRYAVVEPGTNVILGERAFAEELADGAYNSEATAAVNGKPFLLPIQPAVIPPGNRIVSASLTRAGNRVIETATTEPIPPPPHPVDAAMGRDEYRALVRELARLAGKPVAAMIADLKA